MNEKDKQIDSRFNFHLFQSQETYYYNVVYINICYKKNFLLKNVLGYERLN